MVKFKVGDIVVGNDLSDKVYDVTNKEGGFVGRVVEVNLSCFSDITVRVIKHCNCYEVGELYDVNSEYFELQNEYALKEFIKSLAERKTVESK